MPKPVADSCSCDHGSATAAAGQRPFCSEEQNRGRRPQRPGNQFALTRVFWKYPPAIPFRESPAATGSAAIIRQAQERSRFAEDTFLQFVAVGNIKRCGACAETVEEETSLWISEEN
jgi:hypothetical protein